MCSIVVENISLLYRLWSSLNDSEMSYSASMFYFKERYDGTYQRMRRSCATKPRMTTTDTGTTTIVTFVLPM